MKEELLPPCNLEEEIEKRLKNLQTTLMEKEKEVNKKLEGHLRIAQRHGRSQFYHYTESSNPKGRYIPLKEKIFAYKLAQKNYDTEVIILIQKEIDALQNYLKQTSDGRAISELYDSLCPARRALITPVTFTDEQYAARWQKISWTGRPFSQDAPLLYTARGERVRSKSEVIIADTLFRHKIPYRYEYPLTLRRSGTTATRDNLEKRNHRIISDSGIHTKAIGGGNSDTTNSATGNTSICNHTTSTGNTSTCNHTTSTGNTTISGHHTSITLHPDFLCLNTRTRQEFYWEHFGLMNDPTYSNNAAGKLRLYTENGILAGRNLIITMETLEEPLSTQTIGKLITEFLT